MSNKSKRLTIFKNCAPIISGLLGCKEELYFCPICGNGYSEESALSGEQLTLEDVPPRNMGGSGLLLTCRDCNSAAGYKVDYHIKNHSELQNFCQIFTGQSNSHDTSAYLEFNGESFPISIQKTDKATALRLKANDPRKVDRLKHYLNELSATGSWDGKEFKVNKTIKLNHRLLKVALLRAGFLLITAMLGYRYAFDQRLSIVREQIRNPEDTSLDTCFWIEPDKNQPFPGRRIILASAPWPLFLVTYDTGAVILPSHSSPIELYDIMKRNREKATPINFTGTLYEWPKEAVMALDKILKP